MDNERNDYALINYFFLQRLEPPRLCAIDLPEGHLDQSFPEYDDHYLPRDKAGILVWSHPSPGAQHCNGLDCSHVSCELFEPHGSSEPCAQ